MSNIEYETDDQSESQHETAPMRREENTENGTAPSDNTAIPDVQSPRPTSRHSLDRDVEEIFQKPQIKSTLLLFFTTGLGVGLAGYAIIGSPEIRGIFAPTAIIALALLGPIMGALAGIRVGNTLSDEPAIHAYATTAVSTVVGHIGFFIVAFILIAASSEAPLAVSDFLVPLLIGAIGTAIAGSAAVYSAQMPTSQ